MFVYKITALPFVLTKINPNYTLPAVITQSGFRSEQTTLALGERKRLQNKFRSIKVRCWIQLFFFFLGEPLLLLEDFLLSSFNILQQVSQETCKLPKYGLFSEMSQTFLQQSWQLWKQCPTPTLVWVEGSWNYVLLQLYFISKNYQF